MSERTAVIALIVAAYIVWSGAKLLYETGSGLLDTALPEAEQQIITGILFFGSPLWSESAKRQRGRGNGGNPIHKWRGLIEDAATSVLRSLRLGIFSFFHK